MLERVVRCDNYSCRVRHCQLFLRDLLRRLAEHFGVLERDVRELDDRRIDDVGGVEASPKSSLDDGHVHPSLGELGQRGRRQDLELRGSKRFRGTANPRDGPLEGRRITIQPLVPARDVGRGVGACPQSLGAQQLSDRPGRGGLAVRPHDVDRREGALRIAERREERADTVEPELLRPRIERGDPVGCRRRSSRGGHRAHDGSARASRAPPRPPRAAPSR